MQIRKILSGAAFLAAILLPGAAAAQSSSVNTFSPYTFYGIGDLSTQGPAYIRSMGGTGLAFHSPIMVNTLNPASNGFMSRRSFLFNFGMEGANYYLKTAPDGREPERTSSFNTFNVRDVAMQFPLGEKIGFSFGLTPYSSVGYRIDSNSDDPDILAELGQVKYIYDGEGGIAQVKAGIGWQILKGFSIGAEAIYYMGSIDRYYGVSITPITSSQTYQNVSATDIETVSRILPSFGAQWDAISNRERILTFGATFTPESGLKSKTTRYIPAAGLFADTVGFSQKRSLFRMPMTVGAGVMYHTHNVSVGADYTLRKWGGNAAYDIVEFRDTHTVSLGGQYTPDRDDSRRFMNRLTYRAGVRYNEYYMLVRGKKIDERAVTAGIGIPLRMRMSGGMSNINLGVEFGERGSLTPGLIRERYFKFSIGLSLFGEDYWFMKYKYD